VCSAKPVNLTTTAAMLFSLVATGAVAFQLALAFGAPWGSYAMAGKFPGRLPAPMRAAAVIQAAVLALLASIVLSRAGVAFASIAESLPWLIWLPVAFSAVSLVLNAITPSAAERRLWVPVAIVLLVSSLTVALTAA
jgi:hypothetical protein